MLRAAATALGVVTACASPLVAQSQESSADRARDGVRVFSDFTFHMNAAAFVTDDERFAWDANIGGDIDVLDYGRGRLNFLADFETILGAERRAFDPTQNNYILDFSATYRFGRSEVAATFHHVSRHLSDRAKRFPIDWNMIGAQLWHHADVGPLRIDLGARGFGTMERSFVDYTSELGGHARLRYRIAERAAILFAGEVVRRGVDRAVFMRDSLTGGRLEAGVRVDGDAVAVELFAAVERRIDADPLDLRTRTWALLGFRLLSRD